MWIDEQPAVLESRSRGRTAFRERLGTLSFVRAGPVRRPFDAVGATSTASFERGECAAPSCTTAAVATVAAGESACEGRALGCAIQD